MIEKTEDTFEPSTIICLTATTTVSVPASPQKAPGEESPQEKKATKLLGHALDTSRTRKNDATATSWPTKCTPTSQDTRILSGYHLPFDLTEERIHHHIKKSVTNFRKPLEDGLKLAITLRHLDTGEGWRSSEPDGMSPCCRFHRREAYCQEAKENRQ